MTKKVPYSNVHVPSVGIAIIQGWLPPFPDEIKLAVGGGVVTLRNVCERCWNAQPSERPSAEDVLSIIENSQGKYFGDFSLCDPVRLQVI